MTYGYSRDDAASFLPEYIEAGILPDDPFSTIDQPGVGELVTIATKRGREARKDLKVGVCGEHGGDPRSIRFFHDPARLRFLLPLHVAGCSPCGGTRGDVGVVRVSSTAERLVPRSSAMTALARKLRRARRDRLLSSDLTPTPRVRGDRRSPPAAVGSSPSEGREIAAQWSETVVLDANGRRFVPASSIPTPHVDGVFNLSPSLRHTKYPRTSLSAGVRETRPSVSG